METLPLDILLNIIDLLAGGDGEDIKSLQILSRTCKYMVPLCRKYLFSSLDINSKLLSNRFSDLLLKNPEISRYVRRLNYDIYNPISDHELNIFNMLKKSSSLQSIQLWSWSILDWKDFPESIRSLLVSLIQLPTVTHLAIHSFKRFPAMAFSGCSNLIDLQLREIEFAFPEINQVIPHHKIPTPVSLYIDKRTFGLAALLKSTSLNVNAGGPIVDFSCLRRACVELRGDFGQVIDLMKVTKQLEYFTIHACISSE